MLTNKNVIITGCARGIGKSILTLFAENNCNVFACARKQTEEFDELCCNLSKDNFVKPVYFDFSDNDQIKVAIKQIMANKIPIHGLVNNAGITYNMLFQMTSLDKLKEIFNVNFFSQFVFTQYVSKLMVKQKFGSIVNISSTAGINGTSGKSAYGASKAAFISLTKTMAIELGEYNIRVNSIAPGLTETDMVFDSMSDDIINTTIKTTKLNRIGKPVDIANTALYLISDLSSYLTGQIIKVDGGLLK